MTDFVQQALARKKQKLESGLKTVLPGEDEEDLDERGFQRSDRGPVKDVDPEYAAKRRAALRATVHKRTTLDVSVVPDDVAAAEEDYDEPEELFLTGNIPVEPFHLRREREEGFFDAAGNYIEYRNQEARDAWLDALDDLDPNQRVEGALASRLMHAALQSQTRNKAGAAQQGDGMEEEEGTSDDWWQQEEEENGGTVLDAAEISQVKTRIIDLLQPGENVLSALRRLGARPGDALIKDRVSYDERSAEQQQRGAAPPLGSTAARQRARRLQRQQATAAQQQPCEVDMTAAGQDAGGGGGTVRGEQGVDGSGGGQGACAGSGTQSRPGTPHQPSASKASSQRMSAEFEQLVEAADLLLSAGVLTIYHRIRDELSVEVARAALAQPAAGEVAAVGAGSEAGAGAQASRAAAAPPSPVLEQAASCGVTQDVTNLQPGSSQQPAEQGAAVQGTGDTPPGVPDTAGQQGGEVQQLLSGFTAAGDTPGMYYNSHLGIWYNAGTQLFMDANTGQWYRITADGQNEWVGEEGVGLPHS